MRKGKSVLSHVGLDAVCDRRKWDSSKDLMFTL